MVVDHFSPMIKIDPEFVVEYTDAGNIFTLETSSWLQLIYFEQRKQSLKDSINNI
jgi:hypothetical protein